MKINITKLESRLGFSFSNQKLLLLALTHPSCALNEIETNRRLEFLGDRVLNMIVADELYFRYPRQYEGELSTMLAAVTNNDSLAIHAKAIGMAEYLRTTKSAKIRTLDKSLAAGFEALTGAIYLDGGFAAARDFILGEFQADLKDAPQIYSGLNPKGKLQELLQSQSLTTPVYVEISRCGPDNNPSFVCAVMCNDLELGRGTGGSKKAAESNAADVALKILMDEGISAPPELSQVSTETALNAVANI